MKFRKIILLSGLTALLTAGSADARVAHLASPDGAIRLTVSDCGDSLPFYTVTVDGDTVLAPSPFSLRIEGVKEATRIKKINTRTGLSEHIKSPFYRQSEFDVNYNLMNVTMDNGVTVEWRAFNDGVAYRYKTALPDTAMIVADETVAFNTVGDPTVYLSHSTNKEKPMAMGFQNWYSVTPISQADERLAFLPATIDAGNGVRLTILESDQESYPGMFLKADTVSRSHKGRFAQCPRDYGFDSWRRQQFVTETEDYIARTNGKRTFPWRIIAITRRDIEMPVNNLVYALASPSRVDDISRLKPGKVAWDWWNDWGLAGVPFKAGINTDTYKYYIDFASKNGIEYIILDEGWYDPGSGDMLTVIDDIDLKELIRYGNSKNVGIVLWTVFNVLDSQLEEACELYSGMGIKGFKVDFLDRNDQRASEMTYRIADAAARHNLILDLHGFYTPTGLNRTYPNILNFESVFGMEEMKWSDPSVDMPRYDVTFPYIRMMAGPVDYTPGAMANSNRREWRAHYSTPMSQGTRCHQLATYIVHDSPFTMLADSPTRYEREQECVSFIASIPTVFDEARVIDGRMGEYIVSARRNGTAWYVGGMTDWTPRDITVDMSFLPVGGDYLATVFMDGINAGKQAQDYRVETVRVNSDTRLPVSMASGGGFAMTLLPLSDK